jgi:hypothetical protein
MLCIPVFISYEELDSRCENIHHLLEDKRPYLLCPENCITS